jgi:hypothetical protein
MTTIQWFYIDAYGNTIGPVSSSWIRDAFGDGTIKPNTLVRRNDCQDWVRSIDSEEFGSLWGQEGPAKSPSPSRVSKKKADNEQSQNVQRVMAEMRAFRIRKQSEAASKKMKSKSQRNQQLPAESTVLGNVSSLLQNTAEIQSAAANQKPLPTQPQSLAPAASASSDPLPIDDAAEASNRGNKGVRNRIRQLQRETVPDTFIVPLRQHVARFLQLLALHKASIKTFSLWFLAWCLPASVILLYNLSPESRQWMISCIPLFSFRVFFVCTVCVPIALFFLWAAVILEYPDSFRMFLCMVVVTLCIYNSVSIYTPAGSDPENDKFVFDPKPHEDAVWGRKLAQQRLVVEAEFRALLFDILTGKRPGGHERGLQEAVDFCKGKSFRIDSATQRTTVINFNKWHEPSLHNANKMDGVVVVDGTEYQYHAELDQRHGEFSGISSLVIFFH